MNYLREEGENIIKTITAGIQNEMIFSKSAVSAMAGSPWTFPVFLDKNSQNVQNANSVLDRYKTTLGFSVCFLLDVQGTVVVSSNRNAPDSFVGKNYAFRPYFQEALREGSSFYMASGVTSRERGFYAAHSVKNEQGKIVGVAVVKKNIEAARDILMSSPNSFYINPDGIVFISGSREMVFKALWPLNNERIREIRDSRQFEKAAFEPVFPKPPQDGERVWLRGKSYQVYRRSLGPSGWSLVFLASRGSVFDFVLFGWIITAFSAGVVLILTIWIFLRMKEQKALRESEEKYRGLFMNSHDAILVLQSPFWKFVSGNPAAIEMFGVQNEAEFKALGPWDLSPERQPDGRGSAEKAREMIETTLGQGFHSFEWTHKRRNGEEFQSLVILTLVKQSVEPIIQTTVRDISERKRTEKALKQKMEELERFNKVAVGRELKMIELKEKLKALEEGRR